MTSTALVADRIITGDPCTPTAQALLVIDGRVRQVGTPSQIRELAPGQTTWQEYPGAQICPGLIDAHVHLSSDPHRHDLGANDLSPSALTDRIDRNSRTALAAGITTVRDLGDDAGCVLRFRADHASTHTHPRIVAAGPPLTSQHGHCWFLGAPITDAASAQDQIAHWHRAGADLIKVMVSGGFSTPGSSPLESQIPEALLTKIVHEATTRGLPVAAHAHTTETIATAVRAGATTIEHCGWLNQTGTGHEWDPTIAVQMASQQTSVCPTFSGDEWDRHLEEHGANSARTHYAHLLWMAEHRITQILGTDAGIFGSSFSSLARTLQATVTLGFTPLEALAMATSLSADVLGLHHQTGRLTPGRCADALVVQGDLAQDLSPLASPVAVYRAGERVTTSVLTK